MVERIETRIEDCDYVFNIDELDDKFTYLQEQIRLAACRCPSAPITNIEMIVHKDERVDIDGKVIREHPYIDIIIDVDMYKGEESDD